MMAADCDTIITLDLRFHSYDLILKKTVNDNESEEKWKHPYYDEWGRTVVCLKTFPHVCDTMAEKVRDTISGKLLVECVTFLYSINIHNLWHTDSRIFLNYSSNTFWYFLWISLMMYLCQFSPLHPQ